LDLFSPDQASITSFDVEENDYILIATDGVWDNLPDSAILEVVKKITVSLSYLYNTDVTIITDLDYISVVSN
jgi:serine/threonine protein phosphatase PrpC